jgi:hypothetical protein
MKQAPGVDLSDRPEFVILIPVQTLAGIIVPEINRKSMARPREYFFK